MINSCGRLIDQCVYCGKWVTLNKRFFGSLHVCLTEEERAVVDRQSQQAMNMQVEQMGRIGANVKNGDLTNFLATLKAGDAGKAATVRANTSVSRKLARNRGEGE